MVSRDAVVAEARSWLGTRWQHQQFTKGVATDCIGLLGGVALALGLPGATAWRDEPAFHSYTRAPDPTLLVGGCDLLMDPIDVGSVLPADVLLFRFRRDPQHFAIVSAPDYVIHAYAQARRVTENRIDELWRSRIVAAYRLRGVG